MIICTETCLLALPFKLILKCIHNCGATHTMKYLFPNPAIYIIFLFSRSIMIMPDHSTTFIFPPLDNNKHLAAMFTLTRLSSAISFIVIRPLLFRAMMVRGNSNDLWNKQNLHRFECLFCVCAYSPTLHLNDSWGQVLF